MGRPIGIGRVADAAFPQWQCTHPKQLPMPVPQSVYTSPPLSLPPPFSPPGFSSQVHGGLPHHRSSCCRGPQRHQRQRQRSRREERAQRGQHLAIACLKAHSVGRVRDAKWGHSHARGLFREKQLPTRATQKGHCGGEGRATLDAEGSCGAGSTRRQTGVSCTPCLLLGLSHGEGQHESPVRGPSHEWEVRGVAPRDPAPAPAHLRVAALGNRVRARAAPPSVTSSVCRLRRAASASAPSCWAWAIGGPERCCPLPSGSTVLPSGSTVLRLREADAPNSRTPGSVLSPF